MSYKSGVYSSYKSGVFGVWFWCMSYLPETCHVDSWLHFSLLQSPCLPLQLLPQFFFSSFTLATFYLLWRDGVTRARLGVRVVGRAARSLLSVFFFAPFGTSVLEPDLEKKNIYIIDVVLINKRIIKH